MADATAFHPADPGPRAIWFGVYRALERIAGVGMGVADVPCRLDDLTLSMLERRPAIGRSLFQEVRLRHAG